MPLINYISREIQFKIVYYGPALAGKTANLIYIHSRIGPAYRGDLVSLATSADRSSFSICYRSVRKFSRDSEQSFSCLPFQDKLSTTRLASLYNAMSTASFS